jgi:hypothetical protein
MENRKFIFKLTLICAIVIGLHAAMIPLVDGTTMIYYYKCSSPQQNNLIIGTSRGSQGIMPSVLKDSLGIDVLNFAFNGTTSPYGQVYTHAILEKLDPTTTNGRFILCVDPWAIRVMTDSITGEEEFPEEKNILNKIHSFNLYPNIEFIAQDYNQGWGNIAYTRWRKNSSLNGHRDGWVEVTREINPQEIAKREKGKADGFRKSLPESRIADYRLQELSDLIKTLEKHGNVYMVRLPIGETIYAIEHEFCPTFDSMMDSLANQHNSAYLSMQTNSSQMIFNDGHHINRAYAPVCTSIIANWIKNLERAR